VDWYVVISTGLAVISTLLAIASLVFGYYWYRKAKQEILPRYSISNDLVIDSSEVDPSGSRIELAVGGVPVAQLSKCVLLFWNAGKVTLKDSDIVGLISLELPGSVIGQVKATANRDVCKPRIAVNGSRIDLLFSFLDYGDVIMVSALYDGPKADPELRATIMGVPEGAKKTGWTLWPEDSDVEDEDDSEIEPSSKKEVLARAALFLLVLAALLTKPRWDSYIPYVPPELVNPLAYFLLIPLAIATFVRLLSSLIRLVPEEYWKVLFVRQFPSAGMEVIREKLDEDARRRALIQSRRRST
jgi:hypothetical protein